MRTGESPAAEPDRLRSARASFWGTARVQRREALRSVAGRASLGLGLFVGVYVAVWVAIGGLLLRRALAEAGVMVALAATAPLALRAARGTGLVAARASGLEAAAAVRGTSGAAFAQASFLGVFEALGRTVALALVPFVAALGLTGGAPPARVVGLALLVAPFSFVAAGLAMGLASVARAVAHPRGGLALVTLFVASVALGGLADLPALGVPGALRALWALVVGLALGGTP